MSEYQYYEFQAIDRPLTREEMAELRSCSSRARISSTRFTNEYHWGDFKGNSTEWMKRYFDAHLYTSNFGSRVFSLRFPIAWMDPKTIHPYQVEGAVEVSKTKSHLILSFLLDTEPGEYDEEEGNDGLLADLLPIRSALAAGDRRALYIGWLGGAQNGLVDPDAVEPAVPPGLGSDGGSLDALIGFLNLREDLVVAAARNSPEASPPPTTGEIATWLAEVDGKEKDQWLSRLLLADDPGMRGEVLNRLHQTSDSMQSRGKSTRTVESLLSEADNLEAERMEKQRQEIARQEHARIMALAGQEVGLWQSVIKLSDSSSSRYQETAIRTLKDLRELASIRSDSAVFLEKLEGFIELRCRKSSFMKLLRDAGFT
ncbi:MAG: hypothetical protein ABIT37_00655 [Luteolibacter sp.]